MNIHTTSIQEEMTKVMKIFLKFANLPSASKYRMKSTVLKSNAIN